MKWSTLRGDIGNLVARILSLEGEVRVVMEATGAYHLPFLARVKEAGVFVSVINPLAMKKYVSMVLCKGKTDTFVVKQLDRGVWYRICPIGHLAVDGGGAAGCGGQVQVDIGFLYPLNGKALTILEPQ